MLPWNSWGCVSRGVNLVGPYLIGESVGSVGGAVVRRSCRRSPRHRSRRANSVRHQVANRSTRPRAAPTRPQSRLTTKATANRGDRGMYLATTGRSGRSFRPAGQRAWPEAHWHHLPLPDVIKAQVATRDSGPPSPTSLRHTRLWSRTGAQRQRASIPGRAQPRAGKLGFCWVQKKQKQNLYYLALERTAS